MASTPNATASTPPRRQSCDRCHGQKLRCTRVGNSNTGACTRCVRQGAQCVYSSSLPKGRPSMYRLSDESAGTASSKPDVVEADASVENDANGNANANAKANTNANANANANPVYPTQPTANKDSFMDMQGGGTWPWQEDMNWDETQVEWQNIVDHPPIDAVSAFPSVLGRHSESALPPSSPTQAWTRLQDKNDPEIAISQLSQLSMRLSPLRRSSYTVAEAAESSREPRDCNHARQASPLIDNAAFESIAVWLAHGGSANVNLLFPAESHTPSPSPTPKINSAGNILHDVFSASHHLLEILRYLQVNTALSTPTFNSSTPTSTSTPTPSAVASSETSSCFGMANQCPSSERSNSTIIRHLVIACHTLLLSIYVAVLMALQHDASPSAHMDTAALGDIRLVSVVQLCSYLIKRQHQAVDLYLSPEKPFWQEQLDFFGCRQPIPPLVTTVNTEVMSDLKMEVQQRLARLQQTLCI